MNSFSLPSLIGAILTVIVIHRIYKYYQEYRVRTFDVILEGSTKCALVRQIIRGAAWLSATP